LPLKATEKIEEKRLKRGEKTLITEKTEKRNSK
jgi:hypothetical protein